MKHIILIAALLLCSCASQKREFFPMGLWYEGGVGNARDNVLPEDPAEAAKLYDRNFADIAAHGINVIAVPNSPPNHHKPVLDAAQKHGLRVILELNLDGGEIGHIIRGGMPYDEKVIRDTLAKKLGPVKDHPALLRVQLLDEPPDAAFERYGKINAIAREYAPRTPGFCCLVGAANGEAFLKASKSDVVAFDMYPFGVNVKEGDVKTLKDFAGYAQRFADWAEAANAKSWAVIQCHEITGALRFPTAGELRCMTYLSLATGNRGVFWFLYQTEHFTKDAMMSGLVDRQFDARPLWDEVGRLTKEISPLTEKLATLHPDRGMDYESQVRATAPVLARGLSDATGHRYVFVVNLDTLHSQSVEIRGKRVALAPGGGVLKRL